MDADSADKLQANNPKPDKGRNGRLGSQLVNWTKENDLCMPSNCIGLAKRNQPPQLHGCLELPSGQCGNPCQPHFFLTAVAAFA
jgi:hypothetical protein